MAFERGDIVRVCLNPTMGKEQQGDMRPCLVLSPKAFNQLGLTLVAPITQGGAHARFSGFAVPLMGTGTETHGVVIASGIRTLDLTARGARRVEAAPRSVVSEVLAIVQAILE